MLSTFISHKHLKRVVGPHVARDIYQSFEFLLEWDYHYWLHRGALEPETGNLSLAELFLHQAKGIEPNDIFVDNELAYLGIRKAVSAPKQSSSETLFRESMATFRGIAAKRPDQRAHVFHMMGTQALNWMAVADMPLEEKRGLLAQLLDDVASILDDDVENMLHTLHAQLKRALLQLAVAGN